MTINAILDVERLVAELGCYAIVDTPFVEATTAPDHELDVIKALPGVVMENLVAEAGGPPSSRIGKFWKTINPPPSSFGSAMPSFGFLRGVVLYYDQLRVFSLFTDSARPDNYQSLTPIG